jgi:hypothetical protein
MGIKGFSIFSQGISTFFPPISLKMLEASTTSPRFPSWVGDAFVISLLMVIVDLFLFLFYLLARLHWHNNHPLLLVLGLLPSPNRLFFLWFPLLQEVMTNNGQSWSN